MNLRSYACAALLASTGTFTASAANADDNRAIDAAKRSFTVGQEQYKRNDLEGARISFAQSYAAWPAIETLRLLAITELNTDHFVDALRHFKAYAKDKNADPTFVNGPLADFVARCNLHVGHIHISTAPGAIVLVDGRRVFDTSESVDVTPGDHTIGLRGTAPRTMTIRAQDFTEISLEGSSSAAPASPVTAVTTTAPSPTSGPGDHAEEHGGFWTPRIAWTIGLGGAAIVSAAVGSGFAIDANSKRSSFNSATADGATSSCGAGSSNARCTNAMQLASTQRTDVHASQVTFGVAAAFAVSAAIVFLAWPHSESKTGKTTWLAPSVGPGTAGVVALGAF